MISQTTRYAFHVLGELARRQHGMVRGEELAAATGVPANYLVKILNQLRKAGLVESRKGWGGGFRLRPDAVERPIRDVLAVLDGIDALERRDCAFGLPRCNEAKPCPLHAKWDAVRTAFRTMVDETRIADLARASP